MIFPNMLEIIHWEGLKKQHEPRIIQFFFVENYNCCPSWGLEDNNDFHFNEVRFTSEGSFRL